MKNDASLLYGRSPAPTCHPREGGDLPASKGPGRVLLASRHPGPDPGSAHRAACASRHKGATPPNADAGVECVVWGVGCGIIPLGGKGTKTQLECISIWGTKNAIFNI